MAATAQGMKGDISYQMDNVVVAAPAAESLADVDAKLVGDRRADSNTKDSTYPKRKGVHVAQELGDEPTDAYSATRLHLGAEDVVFN